MVDNFSGSFLIYDQRCISRTIKLIGFGIAFIFYWNHINTRVHKRYTLQRLYHFQVKEAFEKSSNKRRKVILEVGSLFPWKDRHSFKLCTFLNSPSLAHQHELTSFGNLCRICLYVKYKLKGSLNQMRYSNKLLKQSNIRKPQTFLI